MTTEAQPNEVPSAASATRTGDTQLDDERGADAQIIPHHRRTEAPGGYLVLGEPIRRMSTSRSSRHGMI